MGQAIVESLLGQGASVINLDLQSPEDDRCGRFISCDVTSEEAVATVADLLAHEGVTVDSLVNNVGIYPMGPIEELSLDGWRRIFQLNVESVFLLTKAFVPDMRSREWGRIVNVASNAFHGGVLKNYACYIASKGAVIGYTRALASDLGSYGVTVNAVAPGLVKTKNMEASRPAEWFEEVAAEQAIPRSQMPSDVCSAVTFLLSGQADFITGQTLVVDGGLIRL